IATNGVRSVEAQLPPDADLTVHAKPLLQQIRGDFGNETVFLIAQRGDKPIGIASLTLLSVAEEKFLQGALKERPSTAGFMRAYTRSEAFESVGLYVEASNELDPLLSRAPFSETLQNRRE